MNIFRRLADRIIGLADRRPPDFVIGEPGAPYLLRWWLIPRNRVFNIYLHCILRSDDDRALHDHPWVNISLLLRGVYLEHTDSRILLHVAGDIVARRATMAHRLQLVDERTAWSLFITGPTVRTWGFWCPQRWRSWKIFTAHAEDGHSGRVGRGCD